MLQRLIRLSRLAADHWPFVVIVSVGFTLTYYTLQLGAMIMKFGQWPNYTRVYDWPANVMWIIESTPSLRDTILIIKEEWLVEMGYMNYEYGIGISQWSLYLSPVKIVSIMGLGAMLALLSRLRSEGVAGTSCVIVGGLGATAASVSLMSLSWVVCCATPSWVVGLSILGLGVSTALWLAPIGIWLNVLGFATLGVMLWLLAGHSCDNRESYAGNRQPMD